MALREIGLREGGFDDDDEGDSRNISSHVVNKDQVGEKGGADVMTNSYIVGRRKLVDLQEPIGNDIGSTREIDCGGGDASAGGGRFQEGRGVEERGAVGSSARMSFDDEKGALGSENVVKTIDRANGDGSGGKAAEVSPPKRNPNIGPPSASVSPRKATGPHTTKEDENFMENFFKWSRLHHIGSWKARYQQLATKLSAQTRPPLSLLFPPSSNLEASRRYIIHIDMDCFFASVAIRDNPSLKDKPVAVCHSQAKGGTGEVSSANYVARKFGIKAGMFIGTALQLCPGLIVVPYNFTEYEKVSDLIYELFFKYTGRVQAVSCDEAFMEVTGVGDINAFVKHLRDEIEQQTGCNASAGIAHNMLMAKIATDKAKPNGQVLISAEEAAAYVADLDVTELPGVGWSMNEKLSSFGASKCRDLLPYSRQRLEKEFGQKTGSALYDGVRGVDNRELQGVAERKSVGAEVNWGVRFDEDHQVQKFIMDLSMEVSNRLKEAQVKGRTLTLKLIDECSSLLLVSSNWHMHARISFPCFHISSVILSICCQTNFVSNFCTDPAIMERHAREQAIMEQYLRIAPEKRLFFAVWLAEQCKSIDSLCIYARCLALKACEFTI